ncbi:hypothetical protein BJ742DRAFT_761934 [Cladochytrium replicatum]|nr:hypothetical protein BJ742DRAFT_761934 [Cladochytrium replicatum]
MSQRERGKNAGAKLKNSKTMESKSAQKESTENTPSKNDARESTPVVDEDPEHLKHCFICTEPISTYALGECNHRVCHICSLRLRALYKVRACALCKSPLESVVFTKNPSPAFQSFDLKAMPFHDARLKIFMDEEDIYEDMLILLRFNCPEPSCDVACPEGWPELKRHVKKQHGLMLCDLCCRFKKVFTHEHTLFNQQTLAKHMKEGDPNDPSFKGHPLCGFCQLSFYGDDELYEHCREKHEQCFLCQRAGIRNQYYANYNGLEEHFNLGHFPCPNPECKERKFVVFASDIDLKAHEMEEHKEQSAAGKKKPRGQAIDVNFSYAGSPSRDGNRRGTGRGGGGGGRGRDDRDNSEHNSRSDSPRERPQPPVPDTAQRDRAESNSKVEYPPLARARQNQAGPGSDESSTRRLRPPPSFGTQLTSSATAVYANSANNEMTSEAASSETPAAVPALTGDRELIRRLQSLFQSNATSFAEFRTLASSYKENSISADEFMDRFAGLAKGGRALGSEKVKKEVELDIAKVWTWLARSSPPDSSNGSSREAEMLKALNNWKVKNAQSDEVLPMRSSNWAADSNPPVSAASSARVLVIKSTSNRQRAAGAKASWSALSSSKGYVSASSMSASSSTPGRHLFSKNTVSEAPSSKSIWEKVANDVITNSTSSPEQTATSQSAHSSRKLDRSKEAFPSLPSVTPNRSPRLVKPGLPQNSAWVESSQNAEGESSIEDEFSNGKAKKGKKGKTVLMHWG